MTIDRDDPRLTAYVLGEMDDLECAAFQQELAGDPQARERIRDIQLVVERIDDGWKRDQDLALTNEQRAAVFENSPSAVLRWGPLVAALVMFAVSFQMIRSSRSAVERERETATEFKSYRTTMEAERQAFMSGERAASMRELEALRRAALSIDEEAVAKIGNAELQRQLTAAATTNKQHRATILQQGNRIQALVEINTSFKGWTKKLEDVPRFQKRWQDEVRRRVDLEEQLKRATEEVDALLKQNADIEKRWRTAEFWLGKYRGNGRHGGGITGGPEGADGVVKSVKENHVLISVGRKDKVRGGDTYQIRRGSKYVGQITIIKVMPEAAIGVFDTEFKGPAAPPRIGDVAEARGY